MMNTWSILENVFTNKTERALALLEVMSDEAGSLVLDYLLAHETATPLDLLIHTRLGHEELEEVLDVLTEGKVIDLKPADFGWRYSANRVRLGRIQQLAAKVGAPLMVP